MTSTRPCLLLLPGRGPLIMATEIGVHDHAEQKVAAHRGQAGAEARGAGRKAGVQYPRRTCWLRVLQGRRRVELWAATTVRPVPSDQELSHLASGPASSTPSGAEGDLQVPEGVYRISISPGQHLPNL